MPWTAAAAVAVAPGEASETETWGSKRAAVAVADGEARGTEVPVSKKRRLDVSGILCPFELNGVCNDDDCR